MKLLIVSPDSFSVFHPVASYLFGGIEVETGHHARGLASLGVDVTVATCNQGLPAHKVDGVTLRPLPGIYGEGYWKTRKTLTGRVRHRLFGAREEFSTIQDFYSDVNPDVGYVMGISREGLELCRYCKENNRGFIFRVAHDKELLADDYGNKSAKHWTGITQGEAEEIIKSADCILAQTPLQASLLKEKFQCDSELMFPPIALANRSENTIRDFDVMWVGRSNSFKRPEQLAEVARQLPDARFCMVFNKTDEADWNYQVSQLPSNVKLIESVRANEIEKLFRRSKVFLSTSLHEGFPNTFLQAAKNGTPVVSMGSNPNEMLTTHNAGVLAGDDTTLVVKSIQLLLNDENARRKFSENAIKYVARFNDVKVINRRFLELLNTVSASKSPARS